MSAASLGSAVVVALATLASLVVPPSAVAASPGIDEILAANRRAVGGQREGGTLELQYDYATGDMTGTAHSIVDRASGAYVQRYVLGPSHGASGFDGPRT